MLTLLFGLGGIIFLKGIICQDPCNEINHQLLKGQTRSVNYVLGQHESDECDRLFLTEGWYRVPENGNIATECPEMLRCGSLYPTWLNGTLPSRRQRLTINACQRGFIKCCQNTFPVEVQNCDDFNVFYLTTIPACPGRYCTGLDISFSVSPKVEGFISTSNTGTTDLAFRCNVMCRMRARQSSTSVPTPYNSSKEFYAGVQLEKSSFRIESGKEVNISIKSTVPVACKTFGGRMDCEIGIELFSLKRSSPKHTS
ncbi:UMOD [Mytilus edulis]|uniref:UMOD n=1 Tax=Mytilus edulis TaxID=6550 RepID=A0A8S3V5A8_MYTED|nr:UMOD [Mytilus edulis]